MKRMIVWMLALTLVGALTACGGKQAPDAPAQSASSVQSGENNQGEEPQEKPAAEPQKGGTLTVVTDKPGEVTEQTEGIRGGTNQNDAVLLPLNTRMKGKATREGGLWYAFTTGAAENATYKVTYVNQTVGTGPLSVQIYDAYGEKTHDLYGAAPCAEQDGKAATIGLELPPMTTYYVYIWSKEGDSIEYSLVIRDPEEQKTGYSTAERVAESVGAESGQEITAGTNQDDGGMVPLEVQLSGKVSNKQGQWYAFTTNSVENAVYDLTAVNMTPGTEEVKFWVYDQYGERAFDPYGSPLCAKQDGKAVTQSMKLLPDTTYYIHVKEPRGDSVEYTFQLHGPEEPSAPETALVFETPFELNSTQVMFQAESDVFSDKEAAKEAMKPVAEVILAHPDHKILLAGTTATDGSQQARVDLSNRRAAAVKELLVSTFGVPEDQLLTIGLGFDADPFVRGKDRDANGKFVESEGRKNRRVVVMDVDDPIAQELLK